MAERLFVGTLEIVNDDDSQGGMAINFWTRVIA
jgi:hypothetical protein